MPDTPGEARPVPLDPDASGGGAAGPPRRERPWLVVAAVVLVAAVGLLQRPSLFGSAAAGGAPAASAAGAPPPRSEFLEAFARIAVGVEELSPGGGGMVMAGAAGMVESGADALRVALLSYDLSGPEAAGAQLDAAERDWLAPGESGAGAEERERLGALRADADLCRRLVAGGPGSLSPEERGRLENRHGWFARLALTSERSAGDAERAAVVGPAVRLAVIMSVVGLAFGAALLAGLGFLVAAGLLAATGRMRIADEPGPASPVMLETFVLFLAGFLAVKGIAAAVAGALPPGHPGVVWTVLGLQWSLALVPLWAVANRRRAGASRLGWNRGRGVVREALVGVCAWSASLPLLLAAAAVSLALGRVAEAVAGRPAEPLPQNPVMDLVGRGGLLETIVTGAMVVVWAPLVEESVFRGALLRSLRGRLRSVAGFVVAGGVSALVFGVVHAYPLHLLPVVVTLGFVFAFLREWRGTLVPSAAAHFMQNTAAFTVLMVLSTLGRA